MYNEIITTIGELKPGDKVKGTDGKWYEIEILPIHTPERMFEISFGYKNIKMEKDDKSNNNNNNKFINNEENIINIGNIRCSGDHLWTLFDSNTKTPLVLETKTIFENVDWLKECNWGSIEGPKIINIKEIEPIPSRCISLKDSDDMLFEVILDNDCDKIKNENINEEFIDNQTFEVARNK